MVAHLLSEPGEVVATFRYRIATALGSTNFTLVPCCWNRSNWAPTFSVGVDCKYKGPGQWTDAAMNGDLPVPGN